MPSGSAPVARNWNLLPGTWDFPGRIGRGEAQFGAGRFDGLIRDYTLSPEFGKLGESTQKQYRRMLTTAEVKFGDMPIARARRSLERFGAEVLPLVERALGPLEKIGRAVAPA